MVQEKVPPFVLYVDWSKRKKGEIKLNEKNITNKSTNEIVKMGIVMVPEGRKIFPNLTVQENLNIRCFYSNR